MDNYQLTQKNDFKSVVEPMLNATAEWIFNKREWAMNRQNLKHQNRKNG